MSRLFIAVRGPVRLDETPASNMRRLYSDPRAALEWATTRSWGDTTETIDGSVIEIDLAECVALRDSPALTAEARLELAERRATYWLTLREMLAPNVAASTAPNGDSIWKLPGRQLAKLVRVFSGWVRLRPYFKAKPENIIGPPIERMSDYALFEVLTELLAPIDEDDLINAERIQP